MLEQRGDAALPRSDHGVDAPDVEVWDCRRRLCRVRPPGPPSARQLVVHPGQSQFHSPSSEEEVHSNCNIQSEREALQALKASLLVLQVAQATLKDPAVAQVGDTQGTGTST